MWLTSTELGGNALDALENITKKADKDHKKKTHLPKMATSLSRTLRNVSEFVIKEGTKLLLQGFQFLDTKPFMCSDTAPIAKIWTFCCLRDKRHKIKPVEILTSETLGRMVQSLGAVISWIFWGGYVLVMIGRWYSRQLLTNYGYRLSTQMIPEILAPNFVSIPPYSFWGVEFL